MQSALRHFLFVVGILVVSITFSGCVTRPQESAAYRSIMPSEAVSLTETGSQAMAATFKEKDGVTRILALSGGGADGAYGAGVLNGWTKTGTRPSFDIVTGVSTGALMSVYAFLGPRYDPMLEALYTSQMESDIFVKKGAAAIFSDSIYDNTPLKNQIEKFVTAEVLGEIAREHARGRRLYVATVNLDASELVVWDMGLLASGGGDGRANSLQLFQKVLRASAAIPVLFPPVYIKPKRGVQLRQAHVDGGIIAPVLLNDFLFRGKAKSRELYVIINGSLAEENAFRAVKPNLQDVAAKSVGSLTRELTQQVVYRGYVRARNSGTKFNLTAIPADIPPASNALEFNADYLNRLFQRGQRDVQKPNFWWSAPPTLRRFDRVALR